MHDKWSSEPGLNPAAAGEIASSLSHGVGLAAALIAAPFLVSRAARCKDPVFVIGVVLFLASVIALYSSSTIFHALPQGRAKHAWKVIEHSAIFALIAGSYTPFCLGVLRRGPGWLLFGMIWMLALIGIVLKSTDALNDTPLSTMLYLGMGWMALLMLPGLLRSMPRAGIVWIVAGGLAYSSGVVFFVLDEAWFLNHMIWHLFVILGTACHWVAIYRYALPLPPANTERC